MKSNFSKYALGLLCLVAFILNLILMLAYSIPILLILSMILITAAFASFLTCILIQSKN